MKIQTIRDFYNRILGYIETDKDGNKIVRDFYRKILGRYDKKQDVTRDFYNRIIARGDNTSALLYNTNMKR
ncbi:MAG: hypothetical protein J6R47_05205 [Acholeplasmatales bacterium]|nr:hypothetical protein [Acholeplasmatales bacterium]